MDVSAMVPAEDVAELPLEAPSIWQGWKAKEEVRLVDPFRLRSKAVSGTIENGLIGWRRRIWSGGK